MKLLEYQNAASQSINPNLCDAELIEQAALGIACEAGKLCGIVNTDRFKNYDTVDAQKKRILSVLGDALWYLTTACVCLDATLEDVASLNLQEISEKFPNTQTIKEDRDALR